MALTTSVMPATTKQIQKALGIHMESPPIPAYIEKWTDTEDSIKEEMMQPQQTAAE